MKSILISIRPKWVAKILKREKTIEVRKTAPKCELPVDVYIYCTKSKPNLYRHICYEFFHDKKTFKAGLWNGRIVAKFTLRTIHKFDWQLVANPFFKVRGSCLTYSQLKDYATDTKGKIHDLYGWQISDLEIFDRPRELCEFHKNIQKEPPEELLCPDCGKPMKYYEYKYLSKAPESYCFVEVDE